MPESPPPPLSADADTLAGKIAARDAVIGVIGLGYVGLPLVLTFADQGFPVIGFDIDDRKVAALEAGRSYIRHIPSDRLTALIAEQRFQPTADFDRLAEADAILICVPTPLSHHREPNLAYVRDTAAEIAKRLRPGQLVILESTTYPGTTAEELVPIFAATGLRLGEQVFLAYSPEREDPSNPSFTTASIPKVVGADDPASLQLTQQLYSAAISQVVPVSSAATAEAVKITENVFRAVNIALVNELKLIYEPMGVDIWEVIEAAKTKPFGYMPFYPGPGLGGHCIPIDPFYLTWKARAHDISTRFIELAGEINVAMPLHVVRKLGEALDRQQGRGLNGARVLMVGAAYKKNVDDIRESPALRIMRLLRERGAEVAYYDPYVEAINETRDYPEFAGLQGIAWEEIAPDRFEAALICTDHDGIDWAELVRRSRLVIDTRNATSALDPALLDRVIKG